jgi:hypothetical protein
MMLPRTRSFSIIQPRHLNDHQRAAFFYVSAETGVTTSQPAIRSYLDLAKALRVGVLESGMDDPGLGRDYLGA